MGQWAYLFTRVGRDEAYDDHLCRQPRTQTVEAVLKDHALLRRSAETLGGYQVALWRRLALCEVLAGENSIEQGEEMGMCTVHTFHLRLVGAGHDSRFHAMLAKVGDEVLEACDVVVVHVALEVVELTGNLFPDARHVGTRKMAVEYLKQGRTLDLLFEARVLRVVLTALLAPENIVLGLGVEDDAVEVEKCRFELSHFFV